MEPKHSVFDNLKKLCAHRGEKVLKEKFGENEGNNSLSWSIEEVEFDQSILLWHIATDLCYYSDQNKEPSCIRGANCKASKVLSDYMLYLLVTCPFLLPNGIGEIRFRDTWAEAHEFFSERKSITNGNEACKKLMEVNMDIDPSKVKGDRSKSVLFDACKLAKSLKEQEDMWKLVSQVWLEILFYAASHCGWSDHAQQLRRGGELLTHV